MVSGMTSVRRRIALESDPVTESYLERSIDALIPRLFAELPALLIVGPRASGKTTTATRHARTVVRLDTVAEATAFRADPDSALRGLAEPILLDEWQAVPGVLGAVKRSVDEDPRPGRFLLTGSVRADLDAQTWPGTGRLVRIPLFGMTVREELGRTRAPTFLDVISGGGRPAEPDDPPDLRGYVTLALRSGFPEPLLRLSAATREPWLESYVNQLLTRDVELVEGRRDPARLGRYFEALSLNTAGVVADATLRQAAGIARDTATGYDRLLRNLLVTEAMPAWTTNRLKRLARTPKRYVVDAALAAATLRVGENAVMRDGDLLGRLIETFTTAQLRAEIPVTAARPRLFHLRQEHGRHEVDIVAELGGGSVVALEIKADAGPDRSAARHLAWMRDQLGDRFVAGVVLHTGPRVYGLGERLTAAPIASIWS